MNEFIGYENLTDCLEIWPEYSQDIKQCYIEIMLYMFKDYPILPSLYLVKMPKALKWTYHHYSMILMHQDFELVVGYMCRCGLSEFYTML